MITVVLGTPLAYTLVQTNITIVNVANSSSGFGNGSGNGSIAAAATGNSNSEDTFIIFYI